MKKFIVMVLFLALFTLLLAQEAETDTNTGNEDLFKNVKVLKSQQDEEVQVEIRKPDNASLMPRKQTDFENTAEMKMIEKLKESNKMLY
jgi:hypothetical protein